MYYFKRFKEEGKLCTIKLLIIHQKDFFKKKFSKERISGLDITDFGFAVIIENKPPIEINFENIQAMKVNFYFDKVTPYRTVTIGTKDKKEYSLDVEPYSGEVDEILKHFAKFQLKGELSSNIADINVSLFCGVNDYEIKLEKGNLIVNRNGERISYPWSSLEYYRIDKVSSNVNLKFKEKKLFVSINGMDATNIWLLLEILKRFGNEQKFL